MVIELKWIQINARSRLNYFPWKILIQFGFAIWISFIVLFVGLFFPQLSIIKWDSLFYFGSFVISFILAVIFCIPIFKIHLRIIQVGNRKATKHWGNSFDDLTKEEVGEFARIERGIDKIQKKLKKKKEQLGRERDETQAFMSSVQEGLIRLSKDEKVLFFNSRFAELFLDPDQLNKEPLYLTDIFREPRIHDAFNKVLESGNSIKKEIEIQSQLGKNPHIFLLSLSPLRKYKTNEIYGLIGIFHDVTDIRKSEQIRIDFVGNASHELRTPLTSIKGYIETLKSDLDLGHLNEANHFIQIITRNVDRLIDLVNDLLTISSLESHGEVHGARIPLMSLSQLVVSDLAILSSSKRQKIFIKCDVQELIADAKKVDQVIRNLVTNAIKYIPEEKEIYIIWEKIKEGTVTLRVKDNGPGIPPEHHDRLFERFYRIDRGRSRDKGGTGLGLAIVKHIMISHGGSVRVESHLGGGAEFICEFPQDNSRAITFNS